MLYNVNYYYFNNKKDRLMNYKAWIIGWFVFAVSVVYWDINRYVEKEPISKCCNAKVKAHHDDRYWCVECNLFCEIK